MEVRYYETLPLSLFKWRTTTYKNYRAGLGHPKLGDVTTGVMSVEHFLELKEDIRDKGCINPLIVEFNDEWVIRTGNNRAEAMKQLGTTHAGAILIARPSAPWPGGGRKIEPFELAFFMRKIWKGVLTEDHTTYDGKAYKDCKVLMELLAHVRTSPLS